MGSNGTAEKWAPQLVNMNIRAYCNGSDLFAGFGGNDSSMVQKVKAAGGKNCEFTQTPDAGHDCWDGVYSSGELFTWLEAQRRSGAAPAKPSSAAPTAPATSKPGVTLNNSAGTTY